MILAPLYLKFKNVANPEKFFKKQFMAAALAGFVVTNGAMAVLAYDIYRDEIKNKQDFSIYDSISWDSVRKHGAKGIAALGLSYAGEAGLIYSLAGMAYWRSRRRKERQQHPKPPEK